MFLRIVSSRSFQTPACQSSPRHHQLRIGATMSEVHYQLNFWPALPRPCWSANNDPERIRLGVGGVCQFRAVFRGQESGHIAQLRT